MQTVCSSWYIVFGDTTRCILFVKITARNAQNMFLISINAPNDISTITIMCRLFTDLIKYQFKQHNNSNNNS